MQETRVLVVSDDPLARSGLAGLLSSSTTPSTISAILVIGQVGSGEEFIAAVDSLRPDAAVWDLGVGARAAAERILDRLREARSAALPALALLPDEEWANDALLAGARGLLLRGASAAALAAALVAIAQGLMVFEESLAARLQPTRAAPVDATTLDEALTPRELEVLQQLSRGLSNKAIADVLHISEHTAKFHVNSILGKLDAQGRTEAVVRAARLGLVII